MNEIEHEAPRSDLEVKTTSLHPQGENRSTNVKPNRRFVMVGATLFIVLVAMLVGFTFLRPQTLPALSHSNSHLSQTTPTATPLISPWWNGHNVDLTVVDGVAYVGSVDGIVSAVRVSDGTLLWRYTTGGSVGWLPVVVNGVVYIAAGNHTVSALRASDGTLLWRYVAGDYVAVPTVANGAAYVTSQDHTVSALRASDGTLLWRYKTDRLVFDPPSVVDGVIYTDSDDGTVYALRTSDGALLWRYKTEGHMFSSPAVVNGVVYAGLEEGPVDALQASTGALLWRYTPGGGEFEPPLVMNGVVYVGTTELNLATTTFNGGYAVQANILTVPGQKQKPTKSGISSVSALRASDGTVLWHYKLYNGELDNDAAWLLVVDGVIYVGTYTNQSAGYVYALRAGDGSILWRYATEDPAYSALVVDGVAYLVSTDGTVYALRTSNGSLLWHYTIIGPVFNTPIVDAGTVYIGAANGIAYALNARTGALRWSYLSHL